MRQFASVAVLLVLLTGCSAEVPGPQDMLGCYQLTLPAYDSVTAWPVAGYLIDMDSASVDYIPPPALIQLDTAPAVRPMNEEMPWLVQPLVSRPRHDYFRAAWGVVEGDSIQIAWSNGFIGTAIRLPSDRAPLLRGRAEQITHDPVTPGTARATLSRVDCPN